MGYFRKNEIKSAKRTPIPLYIRTPCPEILDPPLTVFETIIMSRGSQEKFLLHPKTYEKHDKYHRVCVCVCGGGVVFYSMFKSSVMCLGGVEGCVCPRSVIKVSVPFLCILRQQILGRRFGL